MSVTVTVSNSAQLAAALKYAATKTLPETILLEPGTYSKVNIWNEHPSAMVTVESAGSAGSAVVQGLQITYSSNFAFHGIKFIPTPGQPTGDLASARQDQNLQFTNDTFAGPVATAYVSAPFLGIYVQTSTNTVISGSSFQYVQNGIFERADSTVSVTNNSFSNLFGDGVDNAASSNVHILNNTFANLHIDKSDSQHSDCVQFWDNGQTTAGSNITINGNSFNIGTGGLTQGVFITDQKGLTYSNVTIENNDLVGTSWNGITLEHVSSALVGYNTLQSVSSTGQTSRLTLAGGVSGLIQHNQIGQFLTSGSNSATVLGNTILPAISLATAQSLVSTMASVTSSTTTSATSQPHLTTSTTSGAGALISVPQA